MNFIDLFSGCGGFSEGMKQAGHECILAVDNWEIALKSHEANHKEAEHWNRDILTIKPQELPKADFIIGSPECKQISLANNNSGMRAGEKTDWSQVNHFIKLAKNYNIWIGENVPGVVNNLSGTNYQILQANNFPHMYTLRRRCFFGEFPRVKKVCKNIAYFPTPRASNHAPRQVYLKEPKHQRKKTGAELSYPPAVSKWVMGFKQNYIILGNLKEQARQIGNAVPPPVARAIGEALKPPIPPSPKGKGILGVRL